MNRTIFLIEDLSQQHLQARSTAAVLRQAGFQTRLLDSSETDANTISALAAQEQPRLIVASVLFADHVTEYLDLFTALRETNPHTHLTMIGPLPAFAYAELLIACPALDSILCNEPEATIAQLANTCDDTAHWQHIPGIAYRNPTPHANPLPLPIRLDNLPFALPNVIASREAAKQFPNLNLGIASSQKSLLAMTSELCFATITASRGCYHECAFCLPCAFYRKQGAPYRLRSIANLVDEIELLHRNGTRLFLFDDEQFLPPRGAREKRIAEFADELRRRNLQIAFTIKCRADDVDTMLFQELQNLGLLRVYLGIESGHQPTLDWMRKKTTVEQNVDALATLDKLGIVANFRTLLFHPWSTLETIRAEIEFLQNIMNYMPALFSFREVEIYAGTPLAEQTRYRVSLRNLVSEYTIADPRAELLRRLNRIVFASSYKKSQDALDQAWFDALIKQRFQSNRFDTTVLHHLKSTAMEANRTALEIWREMLAWAQDRDIYDAGLVNERTVDWTSRINSIPIDSAYPFN